MNSRNNEKIVIQPEKRHEILNGLRQVLSEIWGTRKNLRYETIQLYQSF